MTLEIQVNLLEDNNGTPGALITGDIINLGDSFFVEILAGDIRDGAAGIVGLSLDIGWNPSVLEEIDDPFDPTDSDSPLVTSDFNFQRNGTLDQENGLIDELGGGVIGDSIGNGQLEQFSLLRFESEAVTSGEEIAISIGGLSFSLADGSTPGEIIIEEQTFQVLGDNILPVATNDTATTNEDTLVTIDVLANDTDDDGTLDLASVTVVDQPDNGNFTIDSTNGSITYTPNLDFFGNDSFTYTVNDDEGATSNVATVTLTVDPVNDAPVVTDDSIGTAENTAVIIPVLNNDTDVDSVLDSAIIAIVNGPSNGTIDLINGSITYTPDQGFSGSDSFTYTVQDLEGAISLNAATATINVDSVNDAPVATDDTATTNEDTPVTIDVLGNDTDVDSALDPASVTVVDEPDNGSFNIETDGSITYTPDLDFSGEDSFTYTVADVEGLASNSATVAITVDPVNDAPVAIDDTDTTNEDTSVTIDVLGNDTDVDSALDPASVTVDNGPSNGNFTIDSTNGSITYTPDQDFFGNDSFTYIVADVEGLLSNSATVTITVDPVNDGPVATDDTATTNEDTSVTIDILGNDTDVDSALDPASVTVVEQPDNGSFNIETDGSITYTPELDFFGNDSFTYTVADVEGLLSNSATVTITVDPVNDAPVAIDDTATTDEDVAVTIDVLANDGDLDGTLDLSGVSIVDNANNGDLQVDPTTGAITYTPDQGFSGNDSFTYTVADNEGAISNAATVSLEIIPDNVAPVVSDDSTELAENSLAGTTVIEVNATDPDVGDILTYAITGGNTSDNGNAVPAFAIDPITGIITVANTEELDFETTSSFNLTVTATDLEGLSDAATITVNLTDVNEAPVIENNISFEVPGTAEGNVLGTVSASDPDANTTLSYAIIAGNPNADGDDTGALAIDSATGTITVADEDEFNDLSLNRFEITVAVSEIITVEDEDGLNDLSLNPLELTVAASDEEPLTTEVVIPIRFPDILVFTTTADEIFEPPALINNQIIFTGAGVDLIDNVIADSPTADRIYAGWEDDELIAGTGDRLFGELGNDIIDASEGGGGNRLYGNEGNDELIAGTGDRLFGGLDNDTLEASQGGGDNIIYGGEGDDLFSLGVNDLLVGGLGDDSFFVGTGGGNTIQGNEGADRFWIANAELPASANTIEDFNREEDDIIGIGGDFGEELNDFADLILTVESGNTTITALEQELAIFVGVDNLTADDFLFALEVS